MTSTKKVVQRPSLVKSISRIKKFGEVFTPRELVLTMLKQLPREVITDPTKTFCDPTCGDGAFLGPIIFLKVRSGSTPEQALSTTFGADIQSDNVDECRENLLKQAERASGQVRTVEWVTLVKRNIVVADALKFGWEFGSDADPSDD